MYSWLWHHLPGPKFVKAIECLILFAGVVAVLFGWVFPWIANTLPAFDNTVG